jgi:hypothetical protein
MVVVMMVKVAVKVAMKVAVKVAVVAVYSITISTGQYLIGGGGSVTRGKRS